MPEKKEENTKRVHIIASGYVQGVGFRIRTVAWARQLQITGWVKNLVDGTVEIVAEGEKSAVEKFILKLKHGSPSRIDTCHIEPEIPTGEFIGFEIRY